MATRQPKPNPKPLTNAPYETWEHLGKASMITSFKAKQNNKQTSPFTTLCIQTFKCGVGGIFFNCQRWVDDIEKYILWSSSVQLPSF